MMDIILEELKKASPDGWEVTDTETLGWEFYLIRHKLDQTPQGRAEIEHWTRELLELLERTDKLTFSPDELEIEAATENLEEVQMHHKILLIHHLLQAMLEWQIEIIIIIQKFR